MSKIFALNTKMLQFRKLTTNATSVRLSHLGSTFNQRPHRSPSMSSSTSSTASSLSSKAPTTQNQAKLRLSFNSLTKYIPFVASSSSSTTHSPLAGLFKSSAKADKSQNEGLFGQPELNNYTGLLALKDKAEKRVNELCREAFDDETRLNTKRKLVEIFDDISNELCCVADMAEFLRTSHPDPKYREAANQTFGAISQVVESLNTNFELYSKLKTSLHDPNNQDWSNMDECDQRVCKLFLIDFEQSGIHLDQSKRNKFVKINDQLVDMLMKFQINSQAPSQVKANDVDPKFSKLLKYYSDTIVVETMFVNTEDSLLKEFTYKTYLQKNPIQEAYFSSILALRKQIANLCGFKTYSHRANLNMILETPENVVDFLNKCSNLIADKAEKEFDKMRQFKKNVLNESSPLMQWDVPVISNRIKKRLFNLEHSDYINYFSLGACMEGLNLIVNHLYNVNLEVVSLGPNETWHFDIYKLAVKDSKNEVIGYIYCDFYQRPDKFSHVDCHFTIRCSKQLKNDEYQLPQVVLHLNFPPPGQDRPTLLSFEMMENLFHEFGHAMHSMFAKTRYQHVSGTRCTTDLAEVPSQLMEFYCREPRVLKMFAKHYQTQKPMDDQTISKLCESKKLFEACELQSQILNSMLDQAFHTVNFDETHLKPVDIVEKYTNEYHSLKYVPNTHWHLRYTHLVGYGAKYYSYLISKSIATKIWFDCFESDPLSPTAGENYRKKLLQFGGEKRPEELISSLIGFNINNESLVKSLADNLSKNQ